MIIPLNNIKLKKVLYTVLSIGFFVLLTIQTVFSEKILTIEQAVQYGLNTSKDYKDKKFFLTTKKVELMQAIDAIKDIRKKESTVRFSLLFNIKMPEKHALPKEIELLMKVPKIETEIRDITKELENIKLLEKEKAERCFIDVYGCEKKCKFNKSILDEKNKKLVNMKLKQKSGKASQKDVESLEKEIKTQEAKVSRLYQTYERQKEKLSEIIGFDVSVNYLFANPMKKLDIDRCYEENIVTYTVNNDFTLYKTQNSENLARKNVNEIYNIYNKRWGKIIKIIESDIHKDSDVDFEQFLIKYKEMLEEIDKHWSGYYTIRLLFIKIQIPKEWFKGELDGTRYFEDHKYAIFVALKEKEDAINKTQAVKRELISQVKDGFEILKELQNAYNVALDEYTKAKKEYDRVYLSNKRGIASYDEVKVAKSNLELAQEAELDGLINYNKQICYYNRLTCGAVTALEKDENIFLEATKTGDSVSELEELIGKGSNAENKILYYINDAVDQLRVVFGLQVPSEYPEKITHYEVLTPEKTIIAKKTEINKSISVLPVEYKGSTELFVRLYNNDDFVAEGYFDSIIDRGFLNGIETKGEKDVAKSKDDIEEQEARRVLGKYSINNFVGSAVKKLRLDIPSTEGVTFFKVVDSDGTPIGKKDKYYSLTESFSYLGFAMNDLNKLKVELYNAKNVLKYVAIFDEVTKEIVVIK